MSSVYLFMTWTFSRYSSSDEMVPYIFHLVALNVCVGVIEMVLKRIWVYQSTYKKSFRILLMLLEKIPNPIFIISNSAGDIVHMNKAARKKFKFMGAERKAGQKKSSTGSSIFQILHQNYHDKFKDLQSTAKRAEIQSPQLMAFLRNSEETNVSEATAPGNISKVDYYEASGSYSDWTNKKCLCLFLQSKMAQTIENRLLAGKCNQVAVEIENFYYRIDKLAHTELSAQLNEKIVRLYISALLIFNDFYMFSTLFKSELDIDILDSKKNVDFQVYDQGISIIDLLSGNLQRYDCEMLVTKSSEIPSVNGNEELTKHILTTFLQYCSQEMKNIPKAQLQLDLAQTSQASHNTFHYRYKIIIPYCNAKGEAVIDENEFNKVINQDKLDGDFAL